MRLTTVAAFVFAIALSSMSAQSASAGSIVGCDQNCTVAITVNGAVAAQGNFLVDPNTGAITLAEYIGASTADYGVWINSLGGNQDPLLLFGLGAANYSLVPVTFGFGFSLPVSIPEPILAYSEVSYSLTDGAGGGVYLLPASGGGFVVDSQDLRTVPYLNVDKGVDVGPACVLPGSGTCGASPGLPYTAGPVSWGVGGGPTYNLMTVLVGFTLSPQDSAALSGKVEQTAIPEPGTLGLLGAALAGLAFARRNLRS